MPDSVAPALPARVVIAPHVLHQVVAGTVMVLDTRAERYYSLDDVGSAIWGFLAESPTVSFTLERMLAAYAVDEPTLRADFAKLVERLSAAGLVEVEA